jgi:sterol 3beta-glucosyltransferase
MKILFTSYGTRGDIQPFIALGKGLKAAGHEVSICTSEGFRAFIEGHDLHYSYMDNTVLELSQAVLGNVSAFETMRIVGRIAKAMRHSFDDEWQATQSFQPDLMIHPKYIASHHIAEKLNIRNIISIPLPFYTATDAFPVPFFAGLSKRFNRFSYLMNPLSGLGYASSINDFRVKTLKLAKINPFNNLLKRADGSLIPILYPYSPSLLPVPEDFPPHVHVTGYWFLEPQADWQPAPELAHFLENESPPVYIGFGSMGAKGAEKRARIILEALRKSGQRGLLARGWGGLQAEDLPSNMLMLDEVPHDWLFPRVAAVVHHGGAGTTAAGLRAGKPTITCPFLGDQPFWGKLVYERGLGPKPIPQGKLTVERLADAIQVAVRDEHIIQQAASMGEKIRAEDGITCALDIISTIMLTNNLSREVNSN